MASTDAYTLVNVGLGYDLNTLRQPLNLDVEISNLLDENYRTFLDTYKGYAPLPGRSVNV